MLVVAQADDFSEVSIGELSVRTANVSTPVELTTSVSVRSRWRSSLLSDRRSASDFDLFTDLHLMT